MSMNIALFFSYLWLFGCPMDLARPVNCSLAEIGRIYAPKFI